MKTLRIIVGLLSTAALFLSLAWWRGDADACLCEYCPDAYCKYIQRIADTLGGVPGSGSLLASFGRRFMHAHNPLGAALASLGTWAGLLPAAAFSLTSVIATSVAWGATRSLAFSEGNRGSIANPLLFAAFAINVLVVRAVARPITDATGLACTTVALLCLARWVESRGARSGAALLAAQSVALTARVSCIPLLAMPAIAAFGFGGDGASPRSRLRNAAVAALAFGLAPALLVFGTARLVGFEHLARVWGFAHREEFAAAYHPAAFGRGLVAAGGILLACALVTQGRSRLSVRPRVVLAWAALYSAFLVLGRGALWPRYFLPLVPAVIVVAAQPLARLAGRSRALAAAVVTASVAMGWLEAGPPRSMIAAAPRRLAAIGFAGLSGTADVGQMLPLESAMIVASINGDAAELARDRRPGTAWSTPGPVRAGASLALGFHGLKTVQAVTLRSDAGEEAESVGIDLSEDGSNWLPARLEPRGGTPTGFFDRGSGVTYSFEPKQTRWVRVRCLADGVRPWVVREIAIMGPPRTKEQLGGRPSSR